MVGKEEKEEKGMKQLVVMKNNKKLRVCRERVIRSIFLAFPYHYVLVVALLILNVVFQQPAADRGHQR